MKVAKSNYFDVWTSRILLAANRIQKYQTKKFYLHQHVLENVNKKFSFQYVRLL